MLKQRRERIPRNDGSNEVFYRDYDVRLSLNLLQIDLYVILFASVKISDPIPYRSISSVVGNVFCVQDATAGCIKIISKGRVGDSEPIDPVIAADDVQSFPRPVGNTTNRSGF